ncbi:Spy/CpxP family protein refolding chaperone [Sedimenticola hydrogenitrophicus]|uniref:Spy/CpxP family protein refolding chaperone n=1 Tax=Sedimenticola hydrogenitrophicus TaxID=2967975 RepID=UPI0021A678A4|nr:Spy/CpxP family protein refolding chaperone [Sedimenticola hydrogenitrophicus]
MKRSTKMILTAVAVVGISAASISYVSAGGRFGDCGYGQGFGPGQMSMQQGGHGNWGRHGPGRGTPEDHSARMEQGLDMLKYKLRITEAQEPAWQAFEQAMKQKMTSRLERREAMRDGDGVTVAERVKGMREGAGQMSEMADAIEQLYTSLTSEQQKIADAMRPMGRMKYMR